MSLAWGATIAYFLFCHAGCEHYSTNQFLLSNANIIILIFAILAVRLLMNRYVAELTSNSRHVDELTGCLSRQTFSQMFEQLILDTNRSLEPLTILIIDIDHFRLVNEDNGHRIGDEILALLSASIQSVLRASDVTCRWEGDKILVALKDCTEKDGCRIAEKMLEIIRKPYRTSFGQDIAITTSIGVSQMVPGDDMGTLVTRAETGLFTARDNGRDTYAIGYNWILIDYSCDPIF